MKRCFALLLLLGLLALPALVLAQGRTVIVDETGRLDQGALQKAAQPLVARGAPVALYMVRNGSDADFTARLVADGLRSSDGRLRPKLVAIYVGTESPRISAIRYEDSWNAALATEVDGAPNWQRIQQTVLNPQLSAGNFTAGYADALKAVDAAITSPPETQPVNTFPIGAAIAGVGAAGIGAAVGVPAWRRRRRAAQSLKSAQDSANAARGQVGAAIADTGQLLKTAEEKSAYDKVSYATADQARLQEMMQAGRAGFAEAQTRFDDIGEAIEGKPQVSEQEYQQVAAAYGQVLEQVNAAREQLAASEKLRAELDALRQQATGDLDRLKKA